MVEKVKEYKCLWCGQKLEVFTVNGQFCSFECKLQWNRNKIRIKNMEE